MYLMTQKNEAEMTNSTAVSICWNSSNRYRRDIILFYIRKVWSFLFQRLITVLYGYSLISFITSDNISLDDISLHEIKDNNNMQN